MLASEFTDFKTIDMVSPNQKNKEINKSDLPIIIELSENGIININSKEISQKFYISDVTIKKTYKKIRPYKDILINPELFKKALYMIENS